MKIEIRSPQTPQEWNIYFSIRYEELRKPWNQALGTEKTEDETSHQHFALFLEQKMVGVLRMDDFDATTAQLRFMAILQTYQGEKLGEKLIQYAEKTALQKGKKTIVLQAREKAQGFYKKLGYATIKKTHLLFGEIQHFEMRKELQP
jgi:predicted GNAT family N-acyltransferase